MYKSGYSVLLLVIIVSAVGAVFAFSTLVTSTQVARNNINLTGYFDDLSKSRSCTEKVFAKLRAYKFYGGDETLSSEQCRIFTISGKGNAERVIQVKRGDVILETKIKQIFPEIIIDYQKEVSSSSIDPNNPYFIDPLSLRLWLKADRAETNDQQSVFSLKNATDDLIDFAQLTSMPSLAPKLIENAINNRPALRFDGVDDFLTSTTTSIQSNNGLSIILVGKANTTTANQTYIGKFDATSNEREWRLQNDNFIATELATAEVSTEIVNFTNSTNLRIISATWAPNQLSKVKINNTTDIVAVNPAVASISTTTEPIIIGAHYQGSTGFLNGDIAEILVYNKQLGTDELNKVITYLNNKYSIY